MEIRLVADCALLHPISRVRLPVLPLRVLAGDLGVDLRRGQGSVPQGVLDHSDVRPAFKQVRSEGMAQLVGRDVRGQPGLDQIAFEAPAGSPGG